MNILKFKKTALVALCIQNGLNSKGTIPILRERLLETGEFWMLKFIKTKVPKKKNHDWFVPDFPVPRQQSKLKDFH